MLREVYPALVLHPHLLSLRSMQEYAHGEHTALLVRLPAQNKGEEGQQPLLLVVNRGNRHCLCSVVLQWPAQNLSEQYASWFHEKRGHSHYL